MRVNALVTERLPGRHPAHTRPPEDARARRQRRLGRRRAVRTFALPLVPLDDQLRRRRLTKRSLPNGLRTTGKERGPPKRRPDPVTSGGLVEALPASARELMAGRRVTRRPPRWLGDSP